MSLYNYTTKPAWSANGQRPAGTPLSTFANANTYAAPQGWVQGAVGTATATTAGSSTGTTATITAVGHGLVSGQQALVTGVTPEGYNGYVTVTVTDADTFTYTTTGSNLGAASVQGKVFKAVEVVAAISSLDTVYADAIVAPGFTAAVTYSGTSAMITGDILTVTVSSTEEVVVGGSPKIAVTIGANTRQAAFDQASSTTTSLVFKYTIVAGDVALAGNVSVAATTNGGQIADVLPANKRQPVTVSFTAPNTSTATAN